MGMTDAAYTDDNPFAGLKVLDVSTFIAGPAAATILADLGADVIKVEAPGMGDPYRYIHLLPPMPSCSENYCWTQDNRLKRSLALDLKNAEARALLDRLIAEADVLVTNFPPKVRAGLRLTWEDVSPLNPRLIYAEITGYGGAGDEVDKPGFDVTAFWARSGMMDAVRAADAAPAMSMAGMGDHPTATALYAAIVTALFRRERTGKGTRVSTSLLASGAWSNACMTSAVLLGASRFDRIDRHAPPNALVNSYRCSDDLWLILCCVQEDKDWPGVANAVGRPELIHDPLFALKPERRKNAAALVAILDQIFATKPRAHWRGVLDAERVTFGIIQTLEDVAHDEQMKAAGVIVPLADGRAQPAYTVDSPFKIADLPKRPPGHAPALGEHTEEILREMGLGPADIERLRVAGAIQSA
jgi:formyl-CoA transferase